ncbi:hypothetical protein GCM10022403_079590 [Streptomyces coacervatus]|uniref:Uncharacterized protein n=1 Tax=Streptomyces coacervatus TaxID=647381 RepID=A0ABP7J4W8_9ACTN
MDPRSDVLQDPDNWARASHRAKARFIDLSAAPDLDIWRNALESPSKDAPSALLPQARNRDAPRSQREGPRRRCGPGGPNRTRVGHGATKHARTITNAVELQRKDGTP